MSLSTIYYLNLSALAYIDFKDNAKDNDIAYILKNGLYTGEVDKNSPELTTLQDPSNPLRSWTLLSFTKDLITGFAAAAFKNPETGEIVFSFRGTNNAVDWVADAQIGLGKPAALIPQFQLAKDFVYNTLNEHGPICYATQDEMFNPLNQHSNISFTGHSLGGGLAQCLKNLFSKMEGCCA